MDQDKIVFQTGHDLPYREWIGQLEGLSRELQMLNNSTEGEFLSIGASLQDFYNQAGETSKMSSSVVSLMSGEEIVGAIEGLGRMLNQMSDYLRQSEEEFEHGIGELQNVLNVINSLHEPLDGFKKIVKFLNRLSTYIKIESAHFYQGGTGFANLAEDIEKLAMLIKSKSMHMLNDSRSLSEMIQETISKVSALEIRQRGQARAILEDTRANLLSLTEIHETSSATASSIAGRAEKISHNIGEVVASLQFHDITRQQMEHVKEALDDLIGVLSSESDSESGNSSTNGSSLVSTVGDGCGLQGAQLNHSKQEFVAAVHSIVENLSEIARNVVETSEETRRMAGVSDETASSFLAKIESGISSVTSSLGENAEAIREFSVAMSSVVSTVGDMSAFITGIEEIGSEIGLIALNARIKAAHTGEGGAALGVIAETIQKLSLDDRFQTAAIADTLRGLTSAAERLCLGADVETDGREAEVEGMVKDLKALLHSLRLINDSMVDLLSRMNETVHTLSIDIDRTIGGITVHHLVDKELSRITSELNKILGHSLDLLPRAGNPDKPDSFEALTERYTMHSERAVHQSKISAEEAPIAKDITEPIKEDLSDDLGDNVELF